jgi:cyanophycinase
MGYLVLQGGSEFGGLMKASDLRALDLAGGMDARVSIVPAAAAPDANHLRAGQNGRQWFRSIGARNVYTVPVVDRATANDPDLTVQLRSSKLIYLLGGFPEYLAQTMANTSVWRAIMAAHRNGAVVTGSSAGAMVLCDHLFDPEQKRVIDGLKVLPNCCLLPHHNTFGRQWAQPLRKELPLATLIGIDEQTGMINDGPGGRWSVYGRGGVTLYRRNQIEHYAAGALFTI